jgi:hypothetical protein
MQFPVDEIVRRADEGGAAGGHLRLRRCRLQGPEAALARANLKPQAVVRFKVGVETLDEE